MTTDTRPADEHVGELLSGYIDGELTQQRRQQVVLHIEHCRDCRQILDELSALRQRIGNAPLSEIGEDQWRETMKDSTVRTSRNLGWILFIAGLLAAFGMVLYAFIVDTDLSSWEKLMILAIYGGLAILLFSVLRQRLIERKTDKYKDVEI